MYDGLRRMDDVNMMVILMLVMLTMMNPIKVTMMTTMMMVCGL